jgi:hypothetical protein
MFNSSRRKSSVQARGASEMQPATGTKLLQVVLPAHAFLRSMVHRAGRSRQQPSMYLEQQLA